jgi:hypothetical protein
MERQTQYRVEQVEFLDNRAVLSDMATRRVGGNLQKLEAEATSRGYVVQGAETDVIGIRQRFEVRSPIRPPVTESGTPVVEMVLEFSAQSLRKSGSSSDQAAIVVATIRAGSNATTHEMLLEAPEGKFLNAREWVVERDSIVEAQSWWTAVWSCLLNSCGPVIAGALVACSGSFVAYVGCVLAAAGGCGVKCVACVSCDCSWWCRWGAGCCHT